MKNTINAKYGYHIHKHMTDTDADYLVLYDGRSPLFVAQRCSYADCCEELECNELAHVCEVFVTRQGNQFIYWRDEEIDVDYLTKVPQ